MIYLKIRPFPKRLEAYRAFENLYPYLSYEYNPYVSEAWDKAIVEVTTMEEVLSNLNHRQVRQNLPKQVKQSLDDKVLPLDGKERLKEMLKIQWKERLDSEHSWNRKFSKKGYSVYDVLFRDLLQKASNEKELIALASLWSVDL